MKEKKKEAKILLFDIETAPMETYNWGLYQELNSTEFVKEDWYILCWCAKWLREKKVITSALPDFKEYKKEPKNDIHILKKLHKLLDEADIVIAHNGKKFDVRRVNTRFLINGMTPPSPYKIIDTLTEARRYFSFTSNRLNDLGEYLKVGKKVKTGGFDLWKKCLDGDQKAWKHMVKYCAQDVKLLQKVYVKLRPYMKTHPHIGLYEDEVRPACVKCNSNDIQLRGRVKLLTGIYRKVYCKSCGGWSRTNENLLSKESRKSRRKIFRNLV